MSDAAIGLGTALVAGLGGAAHCAAMCGGIATAAGASFRTERGLPLAAALAFNSGRLAGYALVGAALAAALGSAALLLPLPLLSIGGRLLAALVLAALALRLLADLDVLGVERLGALFWARLRPLFGRLGRLPPRLRPAALGLLWGFMPCGLVYSMLLVAGASGNASSGALTMLAFGAGTLPALLGLTLGGAALGAWLRRPGLRRIAGVLVMLAALWTLAGALGHPPGPHHDHAHARIGASEQPAAVAAG